MPGWKQPIHSGLVDIQMFYIVAVADKTWMRLAQELALKLTEVYIYFILFYFIMG